MHTEEYSYYYNRVNGLKYRISDDSIEFQISGGRWVPSSHDFESLKEDQYSFEEVDEGGKPLSKPIGKPSGKPTVMQVFRLLTRSGRRRSWDIADYLHGLGVKGERHSESSCPIANFFKKHGIDAEVKTNGILADGKIWDLPDGVKYFVEGFDCGDWSVLKA